jgi:hypothetical protein
MPGGLELTEPPPFTVTVKVGAEVPLKLAVALRSALSVSAQVVDEPLQAPPQLLNVAPLPGDSVSVILAPALNDAVQVPLEQLMPDGEDVTAPEPVTVTLSVCTAGDPPKVAVTLWLELIVTVQVVDEPPQAPAQPVNDAPPSGVAVSVTVVPAAKLALHCVPRQLLMPGGDELTMPPLIAVTLKV